MKVGQSSTRIMGMRVPVSRTRPAKTVPLATRISHHIPQRKLSCESRRVLRRDGEEPSMRRFISALLSLSGAMMAIPGTFSYTNPLAP